MGIAVAVAARTAAAVMGSTAGQTPAPGCHRTPFASERHLYAALPREQQQQTHHETHFKLGSAAVAGFLSSVASMSTSTRAPHNTTIKWCAVMLEKKGQLELSQ